MIRAKARMAAFQVRGTLAPREQRRAAEVLIGAINAGDADALRLTLMLKRSMPGLPLVVFAGVVPA